MTGEEKKSFEDSHEDKEEQIWEIPDTNETEELKTLEVDAKTTEKQKKKAASTEKQKKEHAEFKDKYLRLYADFENYKRLVAKDKEELIKYSNESLLNELLTVIDHLELALQHSANNEATSALFEGVEMTLKELTTILEKFGVVNIEALGKPFDPSVHHAMSQIESKESSENMVVAEFRKGYMLKDRVLRAALVGVSKKSNKESLSKEEE